MLIISRRVGEGFKISDDIEVTVTKISGDRVKISIKAPPHVLVERFEAPEIDTLPTKPKDS